MKRTMIETFIDQFDLEKKNYDKEYEKGKERFQKVLYEFYQSTIY